MLLLGPRCLSSLILLPHLAYKVVPFFLKSNSSLRNSLGMDFTWDPASNTKTRSCYIKQNASIDPSWCLSAACQYIVKLATELLTEDSAIVPVYLRHVYSWTVDFMSTHLLNEEIGSVWDEALDECKRFCDAHVRKQMKELDINERCNELLEEISTFSQLIQFAATQTIIFVWKCTREFRCFLIIVFQFQTRGLMLIKRLLFGISPLYTPLLQVFARHWMKSKARAVDVRQKKQSLLLSFLRRPQREPSLTTTSRSGTFMIY
jgi:hypothetical protein